MSKLYKLHDYICKSIFTIEPPLTPDRLPHAFCLLVKLIHNEDDVKWDYGSESHTDLASLITGAYWWFTNWHSGQNSEEYATLCALGEVFKPGMSVMEEGTCEHDVYLALESIFMEFVKCQYCGQRCTDENGCDAYMSDGESAY